MCNGADVPPAVWPPSMPSVALVSVEPYLTPSTSRSSTGGQLGTSRVYAAPLVVQLFFVWTIASGSGTPDTARLEALRPGIDGLHVITTSGSYACVSDVDGSATSQSPLAVSHGTSSKREVPDGLGHVVDTTIVGSTLLPQATPPR